MPAGQSGQIPMMPGGQYIDSALGTIGKYAGEERKKQLEKGVVTALNGKLTRGDCTYG